MDNYQPANPYLPSTPPNGHQPASSNGSGALPPAPAVLPRPRRLPPVFSVVATGVLSFLAGIIFTILMQTHPLEGTPLELVQRPLLAASNIPQDAHKEWLALQQSFALSDKYFYEQDKINHREMIYAAAEAAIEKLGDRFTAFNRPVVAKANNDFISGKYVGVGITPEIKDGRYLVKRLVPNSSAEKAGIKPGDSLSAINGGPVAEPVTNESAIGITEKLRGEVNTRVKLTFRRPADNNKETEYELTRTELIQPSVDIQLLNNSVAYIEMTRVFGSNTIKEFDDKMKEILKQNPTGFILDMRNNGGGSVDTARQLLGRFLNGGVAYYEDAPSNNVKMRPVEVSTSPDLKLYDKPLVVLVNGGSASSTEITAAALRDRERAILIGEKTYGKGSAQYVLNLEDKSALRVTFEHWFTPNKINLYESKGLKPDIEIVPTETQRKLNQDPQLDRALEYIATR